jgi:hypothetical protein
MRPGPRTVKWVQTMQSRIDPAEAERITRRMMQHVDDAAAHRWEAAVQRAAELPGDIRPEKIAALTKSFSRQLGAAGAGAGVAAASPIVGTAATMLAATAELAWFTARAGDLILTIAALHGRPEPSIDERRAWVLAVLIYGGSARDGFAKAVNEATTGVTVHDPGRRLPLSTLQTVNRLMSRTMLRRYGARRGAVALGTAIPLGIGAAIGATANYTAIQSLAKHADQFFARLPYSAIDAESIDITGHELPPPVWSPPA